MSEQHPSAKLTTLLPRVLKLNAGMLLYFLMPNFLSFVGVLIIASQFVCQNSCNSCCQQKNQNENGEQCKGVLPCLNSSYQTFLNEKLSKQLITVVLLGFGIQLLDLFPSWFIVVVGVEVFALKPLLANVIELGKCYLQKGSNAIDLLLQRIPKYQG